MNITFADMILRKLANNDSRSLAELGKKRSDKLRRRLVDLSDAESLEALRYLPGNYHELKGDRKGQWACDLD